MSNFQMPRLTFNSPGAKRLYDELASTDSNHAFANYVRRRTDQVEATNSLRLGDTFDLKRIISLEFYTLSDLHRLHAALIGAVLRAQAIDKIDRLNFIDQVDKFAIAADRGFDTERSSFIKEIPFHRSSELFSGFSLRLDLVGGSLVRIIATLRPSEILIDFFSDISKVQIDTLLDLRRRLAGFPWEDIHISVDKGNDRKQRLIEEIDRDITQNVVGFFMRDLCPGIYMESFGGTPILQVFYHRDTGPATSFNDVVAERIQHRTSFFQILAQSGVDLDYRTASSIDGDEIIEQSPRNRSALVATGKIIGRSSSFSLIEIDLLTMLGEKARLWLQLCQLHDIERSYVRLMLKKKTADLRAKRLETYKLRATHNLIISATEKRDRFLKTASSQPALSKFFYDGMANRSDYATQNYGYISSLGKQLTSKLSAILDDSDVVRDEADSVFQRNIQCIAVAVAVFSVLAALFTPMLQIRIERWVGECSTAGQQCPATYTTCWWLQPLR
jgi:hypothetical protein